MPGCVGERLTKTIGDATNHRTRNEESYLQVELEDVAKGATLSVSMRSIWHRGTPRNAMPLIDHLLICQSMTGLIARWMD